MRKLLTKPFLDLVARTGCRIICMVSSVFKKPYRILPHVTILEEKHHHKHILLKLLVCKYVTICSKCQHLKEKQILWCIHIFFLDHIFQCQYSSTDEKQRAPTAKADKGFFGSSGKLIMECTMDRDIFYHGQELPVHVVINNNSKKSVKSIRVSIGRLLHMYMIKLDLKLLTFWWK